MARVRARHLAFAALLVVILYCGFSRNNLPRLGGHGDLDRTTHGSTAQLALYMNDPSAIPHIAANQSSFDWSAANFTYPPERTPKLPPPPPRRPRIQYGFTKESWRVRNVQEQRRLEVKKVFEKAWASYKEHAWMKDALKPLSGSYVAQFSGWAATLVDSLDTLWIMGLRDEFYEAVAAVAEIDFGQSTSHSVNMFETNIRYLGGLIAAYDLSGHPVLKTKAVEVGNLLYTGFNTENGMPVDFIGFGHAKEGTAQEVEWQVVSASPGTITLEFSRLSQITGDDKYYAAVSHLMDTFYEGQNKTLLPGMWPMHVSMKKKDVTSGDEFTIAGNADSLYEYLPKAHALLGSADASSAKYEIMSRTFLDTAMENLVFRPMIPGNEDILIPGIVNIVGDEPRLKPQSEHLSCFIGGLYALAGRLFSNDTYLQVGDKLARGSAYGYTSFPSGIMPERYTMVPCASQTNCKWDEDVYIEEAAKHYDGKTKLPPGFTSATDPRYILRPEAIESVFILYRITGNTWFRDVAWDMFTAVSNLTATEYANAAIDDVTRADGGTKTDYMESFWLAETLKYFYLCFADEGLISLDEWVLNTEAHPFRLATEGA